MAKYTILYLRNFVELEVSCLLVTSGLSHENSGLLSGLCLLFSHEHHILTASSLRRKGEVIEAELVFSSDEILPMTVRMEGEDLMAPAGLLVLQ